MLQGLVPGISIGAIYGLMAIGIVLVYKSSRVLNFAQGELGTFAVFFTWWLSIKNHVPGFLGVAAGIAAAGIVAFAFEYLVIRRMIDSSRLAVAVTTIGFFLLLIAAESIIWSESILVMPSPFKSIGPKLLGFYVSPIRILAFVAVGTLALGIGAFLRFTDFGLGVVAAAQDSTAVRLVGIKLKRISSFTWVLAGVIGAVAGLLNAPIEGAFSPGFMTVIFVKALAAALIGGITSLPGAFVGGIVVGVMEQMVQRAFADTGFPGVPSIAVLILILGVLLFRPQGILGKASA